MVLLNLAVELPDDADAATVDMQIGAISRKVAAGEPISVAVNGLDIMLTLQSLSFGSNPKESIKRSGSWFSRKKSASTSKSTTPGRTTPPAAAALPSAGEAAQPDLTDAAPAPAPAEALSADAKNLAEFISVRDAAAEKVKEKERAAEEKKRLASDKKAKGRAAPSQPPEALPATAAAPAVSSDKADPVRTSSSAAGEESRQSSGPISVPLEKRLSLLQAYFAPSDDDELDDDAFMKKYGYDEDSPERGGGAAGGAKAKKKPPAGAPKLTEAEKANPLYGGGSGGGAPALPALQTNASSEGASEKKKALWPTKGPTAPANEGGVSYEGELSPNGGYGGRPLRWDD